MLVEVFVDEGEPAMFECRVEPKHDLNLSGTYSQIAFKGSLTRDVRLQVFFINQCPPGP